MKNQTNKEIAAIKNDKNIPPYIKFLDCITVYHILKIKYTYLIKSETSFLDKTLHFPSNIVLSQGRETQITELFSEG